MTHTTDRDTLILLPTYNEAANVARLYREIRGLGVKTDLLFIDDNSPDGTGRILDDIAAMENGVHVIHRGSKLGIGGAHLDGIKWAYTHGYQRLLTMDCDFAHSPRYIPLLFAESERADVVVGTRFHDAEGLPGWSLLRRVLTHAGHLASRLLLGMPYDATGAFRVYRLDRIPAGIFGLVENTGYAFFFKSLYLLMHNGLSIREVPVQLPARTYGTSKMRLQDALASLWTLGRLFFETRWDPRRHLPVEPPMTEGSDARGAWDGYWTSSPGLPRRFYDAIAGAYRTAVIRPALDRALHRHFPDGARVLHAGCGGGQVDRNAARRLQVIALDLSAVALALYRARHSARVRLLQGSILELPLQSGVVDGVYNLGVMEHLDAAEIGRALAEFRRITRPGGRVVLFWPPKFGLSVRVLGAVQRGLGRPLHPPEPSLLGGRDHAEALLRAAGLALVDYRFGVGDFFTQAVVVAERQAATETQR